MGGDNTNNKIGQIPVFKTHPRMNASDAAPPPIKKVTHRVAFFIGVDAPEIESASGTDAGRRQGFGKHACRCLSGFRLQAKTREIPAASTTNNKGRR